MSYVIAELEMMTSAATDLATIASDLGAAHATAALPTVQLIPAAADEVSVGVAHLFASCAADYHGLARHAAEFHAQFVDNLKASAASYSSIDEATRGLLPTLKADADQWRTNQLYSIALQYAQYDTSNTDGGQYTYLAPQFASTVASQEGRGATFVLLTWPISIPLWFSVYYAFWTNPGGLIL
jgi:PE family